MSHEGTDFLYPFIEGDERDATALLSDLAASAAAKGTESARLQAESRAVCADDLGSLAADMAGRFEGGGRLFAFGNGGSSTDAAGVVALFRTPPWGRPLPARSLVDDRAVLTALSNDVGFELVFSRQIIAYCRAGDVVLGISTSGNSTNLMAAYAEARRRGLLTVGLAGYDGGQMAGSSDVKHCLIVRSDSVHRIQESQAALAFDLWSRIQVALTAGSRA